MNADQPEQRVGDDVERDQQPVVANHGASAVVSGFAHQRLDLVAEPGAAELLGVRDGWRRRRTVSAIASAIAVGKGVDGQVVDQHAGLARHHRLDARRRGPSATTGRPQAWASSGTMPKSSSPGSSTTLARRIEFAHRRRPARGRETVRRPRAPRSSADRVRTVADDLQRHAGQGAGVDGELDSLVGHERRHDQRKRLRRAPSGTEERPCRRVDTPLMPRDYSIGRSCPQHSEK